MSDNLCLGCAHKGKPIFQGVRPEGYRKDVRYNKEALSKQSARVGWMFGNSDDQSQAPMANVSIAGWSSAASTSLWMNQQHGAGLLLFIWTSISGTHD